MFAEFLQMLGRSLDILSFLATTFIFWAPFILVPAVYFTYRQYTQRKHIVDIDWKLLEIKLPKEIKKTPLAMEVVLSVLYQTSAGTWLEQLVEGRVRPWFSLEMISEGGSVRFFIRTPETFRTLIQAQIYAQYPSVELFEVDDYVQDVDFSTSRDSEWDIFGMEYRLTKPDAYPIKTYVDFGLDREGIKDEERTDPLSTDLELLGQVNKDERYWIQILVQATQKRFRGKKSGWMNRAGKQDWREEGKALIEEIMEKSKSEMKADGGFSMNSRSPVDDEAIKAIERNISKLGFDCGIRSLYLMKGKFRGAMAKTMLGYFRQYGSNALNSFAPKNVTGFDFPWQDFRNIRMNRLKNNMFNAYKRRSYFYAPFKRQPFVLNAEELATIFHLPGKAVEAPMLQRIESRKGEPPTNLPI